MNQRYPQSRHTPHCGSEKTDTEKGTRARKRKRAQGGLGQWLTVATAGYHNLSVNITCGLIVPPRGQTSEPTPLSPPTPLPPPTPQWADFRAYPPRPRASRVSTLYEHPLRPSVWAPSALWAHLPSLRAPSTLWAPPSPCPSAHTRLRVPYHPFPATPPVAAPLSRVADSRRYPLYPLSPHLPPPSADRHPTPPTPPSYPLPPPRQSLDSQGNINRKIMVYPAVMCVCASVAT